MKNTCGYITLTVVKGIPPEWLEKIFEPFFTTNRQESGMDLGLHIVSNFLVTHQLKEIIHCDSVEGVGTAFTIEIPINS